MENKILVVEDDDREIVDIVKEFNKYGIPEDRLDIAKNLTEAKLFIGDFVEGIKKYSAITLDYTLELHSNPTEITLPLLHKIKQSKYEGFIIAASHSNFAQKLMIEEGATHKVPHFKYQVAKIIVGLLGENK